MIGRRRRAERTRNRRYILAREGTGWTDQEILDAIRLWSQLTLEPPRWIDWTPARLLERGKLPMPGVLEGHWPTARQVESRFGSFNAGVSRAGLRPRPAHRPRKQSTNEKE